MKFIKIAANTFLILVVLVFIIFPMNPNARIGMFMLVVIPYIVWALLKGIKGKLNKSPADKGFEACKKNIPKTNNPYLKPIAENDDIESAELWFSGYIAAEKGMHSKS